MRGEHLLELEPEPDDAQPQLLVDLALAELGQQQRQLAELSREVEALTADRDRLAAEAAEARKDLDKLTKKVSMAMGAVGVNG